MTAAVLRADARRLPLPDASVDLIVTSPPYFGLRSYTDGGEHYDGQIGSEATPADYVATLLDCTREWIRVLKPEGSLFVNLGDKYSGAQQQSHGRQPAEASSLYWQRTDPKRTGIPNKSLMGLPWRYALACIDQLGLILRAEIIWAKPNGLPESVTDRVRRAHEQVFHFTRQPRYYSAVDEVREAYDPATAKRYAAGYNPRKLDGQRPGIGTKLGGDTYGENPLGKLPGSVWSIPSAPLTVPARLGVDHFAAFPPALVRPVVLGSSPPGICTACGEGRRPVTSTSRDVFHGDGNHRPGAQQLKDGAAVKGFAQVDKWRTVASITGYACACTPYTDHPGTGEPTRRRAYDPYQNGGHPQPGVNGRNQAGEYERVGPWREYHVGGWTPPPSRPAVVVDPFGGTGTTAMVADVLGRHGISVDLSADYCRLARWRTRDAGERARALGVPKPPPVPDGQLSLLDTEASA